MCFHQFKIIFYTCHHSCICSFSFLYSFSTCAKCIHLTLSIVFLFTIKNFTVMAEKLFKKLLSLDIINMVIWGDS